MACWALTKRVNTRLHTLQEFLGRPSWETRRRTDLKITPMSAAPLWKLLATTLLATPAFAFTTASFLNRAPRTAWISAAAGRSRPPTCQLGNIRWPWEQQPGGGADDDADDERGKFKRQSELEPGCAPLGVVTAGFDDDALEALAMTVEDLYEGPDGEEMAHVPIAVLSKSDLRLRLRDVLAKIDERDSVLPDAPAQPRVPLVLLSGFSTTAVSATVRALRGLELTGGADGVRPMFAVAVPNALDKSFGLLIDEIEGDHLALASQPPKSPA